MLILSRSLLVEMLASSVVHVLICLTLATPSWSTRTEPQYLTVTIPAQTQTSQPPTKPETCLDGIRPNEVYIIKNPAGLCGTSALEPCTNLEHKIGGLCGNMCVKPLNATTGESVDMYGLSHPRQDGGFFILYNGTNCEQDTMYLRYAAQRTGTGPVRYVQTTHIRPMEVSPFRSFRYYSDRDQAAL